MEKSCITQTKDVRVHNYQTPSIKVILDEIREEYCLKQNQFNPKGASPNIFVSKLQWRMRTYYKDLYNSRNVAKK